MDTKATALILIGYQNDYFSPQGILHAAIEESSLVTRTLENSLRLIRMLAPSPITMVTTPVFFTTNYEELVHAVGILKTIREVRAFQKGASGSDAIAELEPFRTRIIEIPGKRGLNAFAETNLEQTLKDRGIRHVVLMGAVTSVCIDSTGRSAYERGFEVSILSDCTSARTAFEQEFYCKNIFPIYAQVLTHRELLQRLGTPL